MKWYLKSLEFKLKAIRVMLTSDLRYQKKRFREYFGYNPDLDNPKKFNEKVLSRMLYDHTRIYSLLADKVYAKDFVAEAIGSQYVVPLLGSWLRVSDIPFSMLPEQFVLKCNHDSGSTVICSKKREFNVRKAKSRLSFFLGRNMYYARRENHYKDIVPEIFCEAYLDARGYAQEKHCPELYRLHCFHGKVEFIEVDIPDKKKECINIYTPDWTLLDVKVEGENYRGKICIPDAFEKLKALTQILLSKIGTDYCRVDWFIVDDKPYFNEFTFTPCAGMMKFNPPVYDDIFGGKW